MPYLIEGLDCSGKKTVSQKIATLLQAEGYPVKTVIGPVCSTLLQSFDRLLVNSFNITPGSIRDNIRKTTYALEPAIDGLFWKETNEIIIKISSHYRAWARAIVENDEAMVIRFERHSPKHLQFAGAVLLWTDFDCRIQRHRFDVASGKTNKVESKRFFNNNQSFFDFWHAELRRLLEEKVGSVIFLDTTETKIDEIGDTVFHHIMKCINHERTK